MKTTFRLGAGHISVATLTGSSAYLIKNFPLQADMNVQHIWYCDASPPRMPLRRMSASSKMLAHGDYLSRLTFKVFTFGMRDYFKDTFYGGSETALDAPVTVGLYTASDEPIYLQARMLMPNWGELADSGQQISRGYRNVVWFLVAGEQIT